MHTNSKTNILRSILTWIALIAMQPIALIFSISNILEAYSGVFVDEVGKVVVNELLLKNACLHLAYIGLISMTISLAARVYNHIMNAEEYTLSIFWSDLLEAIKVAMISIVLSTGMTGILIISLLLLLEKFDKTKLGNIVAELSDKWQYFIVFTQYISIPFIYFLYEAIVDISITTIFALLLYLEPIFGEVILALSPLIQLGVWGPVLLLIIGLAYIHGYSLRDLWFVGNESNDDEPLFSMDKFKSLMKCYFISTPSFILSSLALILYLYYSGVAAPIVLWLSSWTLEYGLFVVANILLYTIQPLVEELIYRSLGIYYMISAEYIPKDSSERTFTGIILVACLNGWLFAVAHQHVYAFIAIPGFLSLFAGGAAYTVMVLVKGDVSIPSFFHTVHNFSIAVYEIPFVLGSTLYVYSGLNWPSVIAESVRTYWVSSDKLKVKFDNDCQKASNFVARKLSQLKNIANDVHTISKEYFQDSLISWMP